MVCSHLRDLEKALVQRGIKETYRGQAWGKNCREWVYFDCYLDLESIKKRFVFPGFVVEHRHRGTHDGSESGLVCQKCNDAVMGIFSPDPDRTVFK